MRTRLQKASTWIQSHGRGARGGRCRCGCGGHGQGRGNGNAVAQSPPLITWKDLDKYNEFTNTNSLNEFIEVSGVNRCAIPAESPLDIFYCSFHLR